MRLADLQLALVLALVAVSGAMYAQNPDFSPSGPDQRQTERDKIRSREMATPADESIPRLLARTQGDITVSCHVGAEPNYVSLPPEYTIEAAACSSDLVVMGRMDGTQVSHLTDDERFIYTDWDFVIDEVLLNNEKQPVAHGETISVGIPGGQLTINGRTVTALCSEYRNAKPEAAKEYLLFLRFLPESSTYRLTGYLGFAFSGGKAEGMHKELREHSDWAFYDRERVLNVLRTYAQAIEGCRRTRRTR